MTDESGTVASLTINASSTFRTALLGNSSLSSSTTSYSSHSPSYSPLLPFSIGTLVCLRDILFTGVGTNEGLIKVHLRWTERSSIVGSMEGFPLMHESSVLSTPIGSTMKRAQQWSKEISHLVVARGFLQSWLTSGVSDDNSKSLDGLSAAIKLRKAFKGKIDHKDDDKVDNKGMKKGLELVRDLREKISIGKE